MNQSTGSQFTHQYISSAASVSAGRTHWSPSGVPRYGDEFLDFSCHELVRLTPQTPMLEWCDDKLFFCSTSCRQRFVHSPEKFLAMRVLRDDVSRNGNNRAEAQTQETILKRIK
jgi:hypothetical protein